MAENSSHIQDSVNTLPFVDLSFREKAAYSIEIFIDAIPTIFAYLIPTLANVISIFYLRKYEDDILLAGYGLGMTFSSMLAIAWILSFNHAVNVFVSQAFGSQDYQACGRFLRTNMVLLMVMLIPLSVILILSDKILMSFGVQEAVALNAADFTRLSIIFTIGNSCFDSMRSFIMAHNIFQPIIYMQAATLVLHFLWAYIFIDCLDLGIPGAAICRIIEEWTNAVLIYIYIRKSGHFEKTWGEWEAQNFHLKEIWNQFKFSISIAVIGYVDWLFFEILTLIAGRFDPTEIVMHVAIANTNIILHDISSGIVVPIMVLMGNSLGMKNLTKAKNYSYAGYSLLFTTILIYFVLLFGFRHSWAAFWESDPIIQEALVDTSQAYMFGGMLLSPINNGLQSVLKSIGKEKETSTIVFCSSFIGGLFFVWLFALHFDLRVKGIWTGDALAECIILVLCLILLWKVDWIEVLKRVDDNLTLNHDRRGIKARNKDEAHELLLLR